jgi:hypothetical protein
MKIKLEGEPNCELDFMLVPVTCPCCGEQRHILAGFGADGTMWLELAELGIGPQHTAQLEKFGEPYLLVNPATGQVLINARSVVLVRTEPEWGRQWLAFVEAMIRQHKELRAREEAGRRAQNN